MGYIMTKQGIKVDESKVKAIIPGLFQEASIMCEVYIDWPHFTRGSLETLALLWLS